MRFEDVTILKLFYTSVVESAMLYGCLSWYNSLRKGDKVEVQRLLNQIDRVVGDSINLHEICDERVLVKVKALLKEADHPFPLYNCWLKSGRRLQSVRCKTNRYLNLITPSSVRLWKSAA